MGSPPTIVVVAHARPESTDRLLRSVLAADVEPGTDLVVSIDHAAAGESRSRSDAVLAMADAVEWPHGTKQVLVHHAIGLVAHFEACGTLAVEHGAVILLEDDLLVGPGFQRWATAALSHAETDDRIAGVSLARPAHDGYRGLRFEPVDDGADAIYAQVPWYDGMAFTAQMWQALQAPTDPSTPLHPAFDELGDDEWFPELMRHLVEHKRWWMLPRSSHATGTGAAGAHFDDRTDWFQVELAAAAPTSFRFVPLNESRSQYDDHMEVTAAGLAGLGVAGAGEWVIDLGGTRVLDGLDPAQLVLTTRPTTSPVHTWGTAMHPLVMNVVADEPGAGISLAPAASIDTSADGDAHSLATLRKHHRLIPTRGEAIDVLAPGGRRFLRQLRDRTQRVKRV